MLHPPFFLNIDFFSYKKHFEMLFILKKVDVNNILKCCLYEKKSMFKKKKEKRKKKGGVQHLKKKEKKGAT